MSRKFASSRREFVVGGAVAATLAPAMASASPVFGSKEVRAWEAQIGGRFDVEGAAAPMRLVAVDTATNGRGRPAHVRSQAFDAVFEIDAASAPEGDVSCAVRHPELGSTPLFLVGNGNAKGGKVRLRAHFN